MNGVVMSVCLESGQASQALAKATRRTERVEAGLKSKSLCVLRHPHLHSRARPRN